MHGPHSRKNKILPSNRGDAVQLMETFIESGSYKRLKELESEGKALRDIVHGCLSSGESRRYEIGCHLVAKFTPKKVFQYDYSGLNEYLYNLGLLQRLTKVTSQNLAKDQELIELFEPYHLTPEYYVKPSFNKVGREKIKSVQTLEENLVLKDAAERIRQNKMSLKTVKNEYERLKNQLSLSNQLAVKKKVTYKYGSLALLQKPLCYHLSKMTNQIMIRALIEFGKPNLDGIEYYMLKGMINKSDFEAFRKLKDVRLDFVILDMDDEARMMNRFYRDRTNKRMFLNECP
ncbi:hypothetical protein St703_26610 [Sporolactobacillus terrae]|uniref:Uncharacterized protein n=2 Tax=Sporolactobacillus terrae TaxID=269673 RepID=A0A5K7X8B5_9BACL|nr:hypothetical protein St703_26610 [Sporolactobacillus terrae]